MKYLFNFLYLKSKDGEIMNETYEKRIEKAKLAIQDAKNILIGGGAGLSLLLV